MIIAKKDIHTGNIEKTDKLPLSGSKSLYTYIITAKKGVLGYKIENFYNREDIPSSTKFTIWFKEDLYLIIEAKTDSAYYRDNNYYIDIFYTDDYVILKEKLFKQLGNRLVPLKRSGSKQRHVLDLYGTIALLKDIRAWLKIEETELRVNKYLF